jgi:NADPH:quinone reductase-like Zn-dependent oxidoreductase
MKAVIVDEFGGPEVLHVAEVIAPEPGAGQIRIKVGAAGVNPFDGKVRSGAMEAVFPTALPTILGIDVAGVVDALGPEVTDVAVGDRVFGWAEPSAGSYAELALSSGYAPLPESVSFVNAVVLPAAGEAAKRGLNVIDVTDGDTVLIHGASGAVGELAVQLAIARGATVIGTASAVHQDRVRALGATPIEYGPGLVERVRALAPDGVDAVFDTAGKGALPDSIELRGGIERIVTIADPAAFELGVVFSSAATERSTSVLTELVAQLAAGDLTATVAGSYPFDRAADAHRLSDSGHPGGKLVLVP